MQLVTGSGTAGRGWKWIAEGYGFPSDWDKARIGNGGLAEREVSVVRRLLNACGECRAD
ncbi:MAG: hypothetical protein OEV99_17640 [Nitrospira sp.]|nr:hypothetical protein [Nitrospira sp.]MDH5348355.1 hypothetical protein [Nitrospira sp.]MDH5499041.1 hypothetical protein [Nitrospira sp.]MDH5724797.1 hypothetical protein [Nitrospira sp.]